MKQLLLSRLERYSRLANECFAKGEFDKAEYYADKFDALKKQVETLLS